ncbi:hypothetical protein N7462_010401 [Penicillium macrosclerotiorum]|uniref:uncharacterized protein n=1 Tax=Penicillium macrosclerotiorum TaxID=303699 RepID=UPI0025468A8D|nr:uncharacterized protein N7462_010401 [Penicillium macrosclerotiorum]KAJ5669331.1 hypothetical protein N7462_010401 [Penicillium macrosclerotiorum]
MARRGWAVRRGRIARGSGQATTCSADGAIRLSSAMMSSECSPADNPAKRPSRRGIRGKWSEEQLLTSEKSILIDADLVKLLAKPESWNILEEEEKREILALLPADIHPDAELLSDAPDANIPPLPESFVRYSNNWRDGIRQFQLDLQHGHYDPEWLRQAEMARRARENGDFDNFKEREFEQFWGQKQKTTDRDAAGESAKVKLTQLTEAGVFLPGDTWRFTYVFGKGAERIIIDKEVRVCSNGVLTSNCLFTDHYQVLEINGSDLTFVIPPGQQVFLSGNGFKIPPELPETPATQESTYLKGATESKTVLEATPAEGIVNREINNDLPETTTKPRTEYSNISNSSVQVVIVSSQNGSQPAGEGHKRSLPQTIPEPPAKRKRGRPRKHPIVETNPGLGEKQTEEQGSTKASPFPSDKETPSVAIMNSASVAPDHLPPTNEGSARATTSIESPSTTEYSKAIEELQPTDSPAPEATVDDGPLLSRSTAGGSDEIILQHISSPMVLVHQILKIDGRRPNSRTANSWKELRCYRKNQDIGSLFDIRQAWYLKQSKK